MFLTELNKEEASAFLSLVTQFAKVLETCRLSCGVV